jgi:hypothetical protein
VTLYIVLARLGPHWAPKPIPMEWLVKVPADSGCELAASLPLKGGAPDDVVFDLHEAGH